MIDELDTFNALATLALARVARFPGEFSPLLASEVGLFATLPPSDHKGEGVLAAQIFGRKGPAWSGAAWPGRSTAHTVFSLYRQFWQRFPVVLEPSRARLTVNAPAGACPTAAVAVVTDSRLGPSRPLPETWALPAVEDVVLFSENGWAPAEQRRLVEHLQEGATITLVRPGERCRAWFEPCRVQHDFSTFMALLNERAELERLHHSVATAPIMLTIFGLKVRKL